MLPDRFVALDVEIASRSPIRVCAIGAVRFESGREVKAYSSLVHVDGVIRYGHIHGLTRADLWNAPCWPQVWFDLTGLIDDTKAIVAYRASFDRAALLTMAARHGMRLPRLRFICAAELAAAASGAESDNPRVSLRESIESLGLSFPGQPHDPLADARAAAMLALASARHR